MKILLIVVSILLVALVLLQSGKAESASIITGGNDRLFGVTKERGMELFITRLTASLGAVFFIISLILFLR